VIAGDGHQQGLVEQVVQVEAGGVEGTVRRGTHHGQVDLARGEPLQQAGSQALHQG
jgi:hypothetical protein